MEKELSSQAHITFRECNVVFSLVFLNYFAFMSAFRNKNCFLYLLLNSYVLVKRNQLFQRIQVKNKKVPQLSSKNSETITP